MKLEDAIAKLEEWYDDRHVVYRFPSVIPNLRKWLDCWYNNSDMHYEMPVSMDDIIGWLKELDACRKAHSLRRAKSPPNARRGRPS